MSEVVREAQHEFWRPPVAQADRKAGHGRSLRRLRHRVYGGFPVLPRLRRLPGRRAATAHWTVYLEFHHLKRALGLSTASLIAFFAGVVCLGMAAFAVSIIYSVQTFNDFHALQLYRMQWLMGAIAAFVAGMLLKKAPKPGISLIPEVIPQIPAPSNHSKWRYDCPVLVQVPALACLD